jgi:uncharacterized repeat protein (TIGR03803 family)
MRKTRTSMAAGATLVSMIFIPLEAAQASQEQILYSFSGGADGQQPWAGVVRDDSGNTYGVATFAGSNENCGPSGCGTVFKLTSDGTFSVIHNFNSDDGANPASDLIRDADTGDLYGTTLGGGSGGAGTIFKLTQGGTLTTLHAFNGTDGFNPEGRLVRDNKGNLYGTAYGGGANNKGVVYKLSAKGKLKLLHSFAGGANDGWNPTNGGLAMDRDGTLYGMTQFGGTNDYGIIFRIARDGTFTLMHSFIGGNDGRYPATGLITDKSGNVYGTTQGGGGNNSCTYGCGTVFKMTPGGTVTVLHAFQGGSDGANPLSQLLRTKSGTLYGTTNDGSKGTVFKLKPDGTEKILHTFGGAGDGFEPLGGLARDADGNVYGTTDLGGANGLGTVYMLKK